MAVRLSSGKGYDMTDTIRLGRIGGVRIGINWTLLVMAGFLAVGLADNRLPYDAPGYSGTAYWIAGIITAVALLVGVLLHELGHAMVAKRAGLGVDGITLWFMGGLTRIEGEPVTPGDELRVSGVGPLVSLVLGGLCWLGRWGLGHAAGHGLALDALGWLALINVALAVFNLLPAAPLDGGRVLHAGVWALTGDRWKATRVASRSGVGLAALLAAGGLFSFARSDRIDGVLLGVLAWFTFVSARAEGQLAAVHGVLDGVTVADVMRPVAAAPGWFTIDGLLREFAGSPETVLMLEEWGGGFSGVVSVDSLAAVPANRRSQVRGVDVAVPIDATRGAAPDDGALDAITADAQRHVVLVIAGERTVGAVLPSDLERYVRSGQRPPRRSPGPWVPAGVH